MDITPDRITDVTAGGVLAYMISCFGPRIANAVKVGLATGIQAFWASIAGKDNADA